MCENVDFLPHYDVTTKNSILSTLNIAIEIRKEGQKKNLYLNIIQGTKKALATDW